MVGATATGSANVAGYSARQNANYSKSKEGNDDRKSRIQINHHIQVPETEFGDGLRHAGVGASTLGLSRAEHRFFLCCIWK